MSILKNRLIKKFSTIPNAIIIDKRISDRALRIYLYLISKPDGWQVYNADIMKNLDIKTAQTIADAWSSLIEAGWIDRVQQIAENGKFNGGYDYSLNDSPQNNEVIEKPNTGKTVIRKNRNTETPEYG